MQTGLSSEVDTAVHSIAEDKQILQSSVDDSGDGEYRKMAPAPQKDDEREESDAEKRVRIVLTLTDRLDQLGKSLQGICTETDPVFITVGRELRGISDETISLSNAIRDTAGHVQGGDETSSTLDRTTTLVHGVLQRLTNGRLTIGSNLERVHELVDHLLRFRKVCDTIDKIATMFRVVRINIRIQCSSRAIREEVFREVSDDITLLSQNINIMTRKVAKDIKAAEKDHAILGRTVNESMRRIEMMTESAEPIVNQAFEDIELLLAEEGEMIKTAGLHSGKIKELVGEVVVAIQFHDSMTQRVEHILHAFDDIRQLFDLSGEEISDGHLGTAYLILDMQQRQIEQLVSEVDSIHLDIDTSFQTIATEVRGLASVLLSSHLVGNGGDGNGGNIFLPLKKALLELGSLTAQGEDIIGEMNRSASRTRVVVKRLFELMEEIRNMHRETRVRAMNTIIMAKHLGDNGRTIEVLAREISVLSDSTSDLADDVSSIQQAMSETIAGFDGNGDGENSGTGVAELEQGVEDISAIYTWLEEQVATVADQTSELDNRISDVGVSLSFLDDLKQGMNAVREEMREVLTDLSPWQNDASRDSEEIAQLIQRYTMEQERMIHLYSHEGGEQEEFFSDVPSEGAGIDMFDSVAESPLNNEDMENNVEFF